LRQLKHDHRDQLERVTVNRLGGLTGEGPVGGALQVVRDVLAHFEARGGRGSAEANQRGARSRLRVTFAGEAGADEGGLATEMPRLFFEGLVDPRLGLFESSSSVADGADGGADGSGDGGGAGGGVVYLPKSGELGGADKRRLAAVGRAMVKCFYEGRRVGSRFAPSFFK
jgi:hypothetical protein